MSSRLLIALALCALLALPPAGAAADGPDVVVTVLPAVPPVAEGAPWLVSDAYAPGERYEWRVALDAEYGVVELRIHPDAFDVERPRQLVPLLHLDEEESVCQAAATRGACDYPLFEWVPRAAVWDVDGPVRIANHTTEDGWTVLRVGIPGPVNASFVLERDVTPPTLTADARANLTHVSFYQETRTDELAVVDLQVRKQGRDDWVQNPTPAYHVLQKFPIQGLDGAATYEQRFVVTDWAGNSRTTDVETFTTPPEPERPTPVVTPLAPSRNATLQPGDAVLVTARVESDESAIGPGGIRLFFDLREVQDGFTYEDGVVTFTPGPLAPGPHTVSIEATNEAGGRGHARWTFTVAGAEDEARATPGAGWLAALLALAAVATLARRR